MVDGAFVKQNITSIGGCIKDKSGNLLSIFFGPSKAKKFFEVEWEAADFLINSILESNKRWDGIGLCSDSKEVILKLQDIKCTKAWHELGIDIVESKILEVTHFMHTGGHEYNIEADGVAKAGLSKAHIIKVWL